MEGTLMSYTDDKRMCRIGDTISTVRDVAGPGLYLHMRVETPECRAYGNILIASGRWRVVMCGRCSRCAEACTCKEISES